MESSIKTLGIIAEYNPYHNGHLYQMDKAMSITDADYCIVILSGHFVQRGEPAIYDTYIRAHMALLAGADAVLEMPAPFSCSSASDFASYGVGLLSSLGIDYISFGCESTDANMMRHISHILNNESELYKEILSNNMRNGLSFPSARTNALIAELGNMLDDEDKASIINLMSSPNSILAIEYLRAIEKLRSPIRPVMIRRIGANHDSDDMREDYISSSAIRDYIYDNKDITSDIAEKIPEDIYDLMIHSNPIYADMMIGSVIRKIYDCNYDGISIDTYADISSDMADRMVSSAKQTATWSEFISQIKTKNMTFSRISRALIHILLGITKDKMALYKSGRYAPYARLIGFRKESQELLSHLKESSSVPIISKMADASDILSDDDAAFSLLMDEARAADIYNSFYYDKYHISLPNLYERQMIVL